MKGTLSIVCTGCSLKWALVRYELASDGGTGVEVFESPGIAEFIQAHMISCSVEGKDQFILETTEG